MSAWFLSRAVFPCFSTCQRSRINGDWRGGCWQHRTVATPTTGSCTLARRTTVSQLGLERVSFLQWRSVCQLAMSCTAITSSPAYRSLYPWNAEASVHAVLCGLIDEAFPFSWRSLRPPGKPRCSSRHRYFFEAARCWLSVGSTSVRFACWRTSIRQRRSRSNAEVIPILRSRSRLSVTPRTWVESILLTNTTRITHSPNEATSGGRRCSCIFSWLPFLTPTFSIDRLLPWSYPVVTSGFSWQNSSLRASSEWMWCVADQSRLSNFPYDCPAGTSFSTVASLDRNVSSVRSDRMGDVSSASALHIGARPVYHLWPCVWFRASRSTIRSLTTVLSSRWINGPDW